MSNHRCSLRISCQLSGLEVRTQVVITFDAQYLIFGTVHFKIAEHSATEVRYNVRRPTPEDVLAWTWGADKNNRFSRLLQSTFSSKSIDTTTIVPNANGFVYGAISAYASHHDLVIRPDDVWIAMLSQLNF